MLTIDEIKKKCIRQGRSLQWLLTVLAEEEILSRLLSGDLGEKILIKGGYVLQSLGSINTPFLPKLELVVNAGDDAAALKEIKTEKEPGGILIKDLAEAAPGLYAVKAEVLGIPLTFYLDMTLAEEEETGAWGSQLPALSGERDGFSVKFMYPEAIFIDRFKTVMEKKETLDSMETWYDMFYISIAMSPEGRRLGEYLGDSFSVKGDDVFGEVKGIKSLSNRWRAFARENKIPLREFSDLTDHLSSIIEPVIRAADEGEEFFGVWMPELCRYID